MSLSATGYDPCFSKFLNRWDSYLSDCEGSFDERIKILKTKISANKDAKKPHVVILGAGPAGLMRAIQSIWHGSPTQIIEKRYENGAGRLNTVALSPETVMMLKYIGVYQYLRQNKLIYPPKAGFTSVRLCDLELAMKEVIKALGADSIIKYQTTVERIDSQKDKIDLILKTDKQRQVISDIDILVNAEGSRSTTNCLLNIKRTPILPLIPVIAAIYQDTRPKIRGLKSLFLYTKKSVGYVSNTVHYRVLFAFKFIFLKNFRSKLMGSLILKTPRQNYLGCAFSDDLNKKMLSIKKTVEEKKEALKKVKTKKEQTLCKKQLRSAEKRYHSFMRQWIHLSVCEAHLINSKRSYFTNKNLTLTKFDVVNIGADQADQLSKGVNQTSVLLAGDACATVDPVTGLGCNTAIQTSAAFLDFLLNYEKKSQKELLTTYTEWLAQSGTRIHNISVRYRSLYRPDALNPKIRIAASGAN